MIKLNNFSKAYKKSIFCNTTVSFPDNKVNFIMGRNGSGKTTLFKCIAGLEAYNGEIKFDENDISEAREKMFVLWDDTPFYQNLSGIKNILLFSNDKIKKNDIYKISETYLDYSTMKREVKTYSYGQKKKLALILLDILKPKYILMDEISNGLDIDMMNVLCKKIEELKKQSTIILTGHQFSFYQHIADNVFIKNNDDLFQVDYNKENMNDLEKIYNEKLNKS